MTPLAVREGVKPPLPPRAAADSMGDALVERTRPYGAPEADPGNGELVLSAWWAKCVDSSGTY